MRKKKKKTQVQEATEHGMLTGYKKKKKKERQKEKGGHTDTGEMKTHTHAKEQHSNVASRGDRRCLIPLNVRGTCSIGEGAQQTHCQTCHRRRRRDDSNETRLSNTIPHIFLFRTLGLSLSLSFCLSP